MHAGLQMPIAKLFLRTLVCNVDGTAQLLQVRVSSTHSLLTMKIDSGLLMSASPMQGVSGRILGNEEVCSAE